MIRLQGLANAGLIAYTSGVFFAVSSGAALAPPITPALATPPQTLACTIADLTPPANAKDASFVCPGPWSHQDYAAPCRAQVTDGSKCGWTLIQKNTCNVYKSCQAAPFGIAHVDNYSSTVGIQGVFHRGGKVCDEFGCVTSQSYWDYDEPCQQAGASYLNTIRYQHNVTDGSGSYAAQVLGANGNTHQGSCAVQARGVPTYNAKADPICGVDSTYECDDYKANTCRPPDGALDPDRGACGTVGGTLYSSSQLSLSELQQNSPNVAINDNRYPQPSCSTCDDRPIVTAADARAKHDCLASSVSAFAPRNDTATLTRLVTDLKLLLEVRGGDLTADKQSFTLQLFLDYPGVVDTCALGWKRPTGAVTCSKDDLGQIDAALSLCGAIAQPEILPDGRASFVEYCIDNVRAMPGLLSCEGYYAEYATIMALLADSMQKSLMPGNSRDVALLQKVQAVLQSR